MDIRIFTCLHGRPEITRVFFEHLIKLRRELRMRLPVTFAYTKKSDFEAAEPYLTNQCEAVQCENKPISFKHNKAMTAAINRADFTHILHLGSDNLVTSDYMKALKNHKDVDFAGVQKLYFIEPSTRKALKSHYVKQKYLLGAGRVMSLKALRKTMGGLYKVNRTYYNVRKGDLMRFSGVLAELMAENKVFTRAEKETPAECALWPYKADKGLDAMSQQVLTALGFKAVNLTGLFEEPQIVDIKTAVNITSMARIKGQPVDYQEVLKKFDLQDAF